MEKLELKDYPRVHDTLNLKVRVSAINYGMRSRATQALISHPNLSTDLNYLQECQDQLRERPLARPWEINSSLEAIFRGNTQKAVYQRVIDRLSTETGLLHIWEELEAFGDLREGFPNKRVGGIIVHWGAALKAGNGRFRPIERDIHVRSTPATPLSSLKELASEGTLPKATITLEHELIHSRQYRSTILGRAGYYILETLTLGRNRAAVYPPEELIEMHAYRTEQQYAGLTTNAFFANFALQAKAPNGETFYKELNPEKLNYSLKATEILDALGLTPAEIGGIIRSAGKWNPDLRKFPGVEAAINQTADKFSFSKRDLDLLVDCHRTERNIDTLKAIHITQEELLAA